MKREEMLDLARREVAHIPDWPWPQGLLRSTYFNLRLNSLGRKSVVENDRRKVLQRALEMVLQDKPDADLEYDRSYFEQPPAEGPRAETGRGQ